VEGERGGRGEREREIVKSERFMRMAPRPSLKKKKKKATLKRQFSMQNCNVVVNGGGFFFNVVNRGVNMTKRAIVKMIQIEA
jgi:hypothetical protein